jgi:hypothetical protein
MAKSSPLETEGVMRIVMLAVLVLLLSACGARAGEPHGLYLMTRFSVGTLTLEAYRFADGTVVRNPVAGIDALAQERAQRPHDVGTYRIEGDNLVMAFGGKPGVSSVYERNDGGCFSWDAGSFCPVKPFARDTRIDGVYTGGASVGGGAVMSASTVTFRADGTYSLSSASSIKTGIEAGTVGSTGAWQGGYRFDGNALILTPDNGAEQRFSTFPYDDGSAGPAPRRIYFGGGMLKRQD